jgi:DNA-binding NarL/FixJ family response regulator
MKKLRILIADDHGLVRRGAREILHSTSRGLKVVGEAANGQEAVEKAIELKPDVVVLDIGMPEMNGIDATRRIREAVPSTRILILSMHDSDQMVERALDAGAHGYILKSDLAECLTTAVKSVSDSEGVLAPKVFEIMRARPFKRKDHGQGQRVGARTTPRETEIIRLLAEGETNKEVAALLGISVRTVETHRAKIMSKLGLHSFTELLYYALHHGIATAQGTWPITSKFLVSGDDDPVFKASGGRRDACFNRESITGENGIT